MATKNGNKMWSWVTMVCLALIAYRADAFSDLPGTLDATWSGAGQVTTALFNRDDVATGIARQRDGKIVVAGYCDNLLSGFSIRGFCAARYNVNGSLDVGFGTAGKLFTQVSTQASDQARAIAIQPDGKLVIAGVCLVTNVEQFCLARYSGVDGSVDTSFNGNGRVVTPDTVARGGALAVAIQPDGKIVVGGYCVLPTVQQMCALRYSTDGKLDTTFNGNGKVSLSIGAGDAARSVLIQPDGKIVLVGSCTGFVSVLFCTARLDATGQLDASFGIGGRVYAAFGDGGDSIAYSAALQADGKIVLAGSCGVFDFFLSTYVANFCAARLNGADGSLDTAFNGIGSVAYDFAGSVATGVAVQPDGKIVLTGACAVAGSNNMYCALRYRSDGGLDRSFNKTGTVATIVAPRSSTGSANAMLLQPDGKLVIAGSCRSADEDFCTIRYDGGPFGAQNCKLDIDGDGSVLPTTDLLIATRVARGMTGPAVVNGIGFPPNATRTTWPVIREYLVSQCGMSLPL